MIQFMLISIVCLLSGCTFNISMAHTEGVADDVIDDTASNTPNVSPIINLPVSPGPSVGVPRENFKYFNI